MEIKEQLEAGLAKISEQIASVEAKQAEEIKNVGDAHKETTDSLKNLTERAEGLQNRLDEMEKASNRADGRVKTFKSSLIEGISGASEKLSGLIKDGKPFRIELKDTDMTTGNAYTGEVIESDRLQGVFFDPDRPTHVRQFLSQTSTSSNNVRYVQESSYTDGTAPQSEGAEKGQSKFALTAKDAPVRTIASYLRLSKQMLDDTPFLTSYINQRAPKKLFLEEDEQILYGDGTGENIEGITTVAQSWAAIAGFSNVNRFDALVNGISQVRTDNGEYNASAVMINPEDFYIALVEKDAEERYYFPDAVRFGGQPPRVAGVPIVANTAIEKGDFLIGDFNMGATMALRQGVSLQFFEQDQDNVITNQITVRIEERFALPVHNPNAFVYGDFATAIGS
jgi:HK97 family phage major capsid protein